MNHYLEPAESGNGLHVFTLSRFLQSATVLNASTAANLVRGIVTAKVLAEALGPSPLGVLAQLLNFSNFLVTVVPLGLTTGVSKMVAESSDDRSAVQRVVATSMILACISGTLAFLILAPAGGRISIVLTGTARYGLLVTLSIATLPFYNLAGVISYVLQGLGEIQRLTIANVITALSILLLTVPGALLFGLTGAVVAILVGSVVQAAAFLWAIRSSYFRRNWRLSLSGYSGQNAVILLRYGAVLLTGAIAMWGSVLIVRTFAAHKLGNYENGIYQVCFTLSLQYMTLYLTWMAAYIFPKIAAEHDRRHLNTLLNSELKWNLMIMVPLLVLVIAFRTLVIRLLFSSSFLAAAPLIAIQAFGDYFRVVGWSFGVSLFAQGKTLAHMIETLLQSCLWVVLTTLLIQPLGIRALAVGYTVSFAIWPLTMYPIVSWWFDVRPDRFNTFLIVLGLLTLVVSLLAIWPLALLAACLVPAAIAIGHGRAAIGPTAFARKSPKI